LSDYDCKGGRVCSEGTCTSQSIESQQEFINKDYSLSDTTALLVVEKNQLRRQYTNLLFMTVFGYCNAVIGLSVALGFHMEDLSLTISNAFWIMGGASLLFGIISNILVVRKANKIEDIEEKIDKMKGLEVADGTIWLNGISPMIIDDSSNNTQSYGFALSGVF